MPEDTGIRFSLREVTELMVRERGLTDGHWMILVEYALNAGNVETPDGGLLPSSICGIKNLGVQRIPKPNAISVDASQISRVRKPRKATKKKRARA